ncbi:CHD3-type chromatin-remodeling factor PICKLE [Platanthera guangdongensis]|uniref:CHD3-type chromatin-remodeling factor PICKLE n=1 Tax=Platanthera guangdongensis TaxID=2320717 RepID=A0ABR2MWJ9_9ASPA
MVMYFGSTQARSIIVDEGHRLKNKESKLYIQLKLFAAKHHVLLTGTPLHAGTHFVRVVNQGARG